MIFLINSLYQYFQEIHFSADELWKPDITLWNSADQSVIKLISNRMTLLTLILFNLKVS